MALAELAHVEADHGAVVVEEGSGQALASSVFRHPWARGRGTSDRTVLVAHAGAVAAHGLGDGRDGVVLSDDAGVQLGLELGGRPRSVAVRRATGMPVARLITAAISGSSTTAAALGRLVASSRRVCTAAISSRKREASS